MVVTASETEVRTRRPSLWVFAPVAVSLLAAVLATIDVRRSFTLAEVDSVLQSQRSWRGLVPIWHADGSGSIYLVLLKGWLHAGSSEWVARVPSVAALALTAASVYALGGRLFKRSSGLVASLLFATSAYATGLGRSAGPLALAVLTATLATWLFVVAYERGSVGTWSAYAIVASASVYVHASCALVVTAHAATLGCGPLSRARRATVATAVVAVLGAPVVVQVLASDRHVFDPLRQPNLGDVVRALHDASGRNVVPLVLAIGGAGIVALGRVARSKTWKLVLLASWTTVPVVGVLVLSIARPSLDPRYFAVSAPAISLLAGVAVVSLRKPLAAATLVASLAVSGVRLAQLERSQPEDWPAAAAYSLNAKGQDHRIVVAPARAISAFAYYAGRDKGSTTPRGATVLVVTRADSDQRALDAARQAVHAPAYALRGTRRFGKRLQVQTWERTGLPPPASS